MKTSSAKQKGRKFQQYIRDLVRSTFELEDADVESRSMGAGGEDVMLSPKARSHFPYSVECKCVEKLNVWGAYDQAVENCKGYEPILFMRKNRRSALAVVSAEHYFELLGRLDKEINRDEYKRDLNKKGPGTVNNTDDIIPG